MEEFERRFGTHSSEDMSVTEEILKKQKQYEDNRHIHPMKLLFDCTNVKEMLKTCCKPRANHVRLQIWLLFLSMAIYIMAYMAPIVFMFQFCQKVYNWDSETYSNVSAGASFISCAATLIIAPILIKGFTFKDTSLAMVGIASFAAQYVLKGLILSPI
ncbi:unnamed protein product, partial [Oppiella nova]